MKLLRKAGKVEILLLKRKKLAFYPCKKLTKVSVCAIIVLLFK